MAAQAPISAVSSGAAGVADDAHVTLLKPAGGWTRLELGDLWRYRDLLYILAWRDVKVRYKQAAFGIAWAVLQPLSLVALFTFVFSRIAHITGGVGVPYPVFAFTGLLPWLLFATIVPGSATSIVQNSALVSKVYFPRLVIPLGSVLGRTPDFLISAALLLVIMGVYGFTPPWTALLLPLIMLASMLAAASLGIWFSALNVAYRDVQYIVPFLIQAWMFFTPIAYPTSAVPPKLLWLPALNPMSWVINVARWALIGMPVAGGGTLKHPGTPLWVVLTSAGAMCLLLVSGLYYFRRVQNFFADVV